MSVVLHHVLGVVMRELLIESSVSAGLSSFGLFAFVLHCLGGNHVMGFILLVIINFKMLSLFNFLNFGSD
jgi:hypothetical protein